jgi:hypothetical protein
LLLLWAALLLALLLAAADGFEQQGKAGASSAV